VSALALLAVGAPEASAAHAATQQATNTCWNTVVNDWVVNQPNLKGSDPIPCYTQAIQHLSDYPDIKQYSSAIDDIHRALLAAIHDRGVAVVALALFALCTAISMAALSTGFGLTLANAAASRSFGRICSSWRRMRGRADYMSYSRRTAR